MSTSKVSFTVRRPTPVSRASSAGTDSDPSSFKIPALPRHLSTSATNGAPPGSSPLGRSTQSAPASPKPRTRTYYERDSSDEDELIQDELVTGFDQFGVQRLHGRKEPEGPLVIPALKNRDWRELARKRKSLYIPPSAAAATGADGSVGGLGTKDKINSGPQLSGLQVKKKVKLQENGMDVIQDESPEEPEEEMVEKEETEDQKALRALIAGAQSGDGGLEGAFVDVIPAVTEDDAYRQDVEELPEPASLDDYERVPVSQFGAAILRGMGWKEGTAASKRGKGPIEPWVPTARPALLGIGAKEKEVYDDGSSMGRGKKGGKGKPERRYVPIVKVERRSGESGGESERSRDRDRERDIPEHGSASSSRHRSPSSREGSSKPSSSSRKHDSKYDRDRDGYRDRDRQRDRDGRKDSHRDYDEHSRRDRDRDRESRGSHDRDDRGRGGSADLRRERDSANRYGDTDGVQHRDRDRRGH